MEGLVAPLGSSLRMRILYGPPLFAVRSLGALTSCTCAHRASSGKGVASLSSLVER